MPQKFADSKKTFFASSLHFTTTTAHIDNRLYILTELSDLLYLEKHEPFTFALAKVKLRKQLKLTLTEFRAVYTAYKLQRGVV